VLHLVMRRQARELTFPALRFVQQRRDSNRRRMRLRHWVLLALRCALVAGVAVALARPTLKGSGLRGKEGAPLAVAVVVDNSLRMQYVHQNRTRLEQATNTAADLVSKFPEDSAIAVCDLGRAASGFAPDLAAAASRLRNLRVAGAAKPLAAVVVEAINLVAEQTERRQEVFVFTDLTQVAWNDDAIDAVQAALTAAPDVRIYVFDVGVASPKNFSLGPLDLGAAALRPGESLHIEAEVLGMAGAKSPLVELYLAGDERRLEKRGESLVELDADGRGRVRFDVADLPLGTHQGSVKLSAADPLVADNTRYFTVDVRPPARILLLATEPRDSQYLREALAPSLGAKSTRFECQTLPLDKAAEVVFEDYHAVLVLDPGALPAELWTRLDEFVVSGGGVGIFLGHHALGETESFSGEAPERLLPGKLVRSSRDATYLRPRRLDHPALAGLRKYEEELPWPVCKVSRFWQFDELAGDAYLVATYANGEPAIVARSAGRGRVITTTTPFSDPLNPEGREPWNEFSSPDAAWPFVGVCDQLVGYLAQDSDERLNYLAGETARVRLAPREQVQNFILHSPDGQASGRMSGGEELVVSVTDELGNYRMTAGGRSERLDKGFSVNAPPETSQLARIDPSELVAALPKDRVKLADDVDEVEAYVNVGRSGRELYPWAIMLVAVVWGAEHVLSTRFYRRTEPAKA
jgi:hypothetical protein